MWTPEIVKARYAEAASVAMKLPPVGISSASGYWPEYQHSFEDRTGWGTERLAEERELRTRRLPPSSAALSRHDEVVQWTGAFIQDETRRRIMWAWAWSQASGSSFSARCRKMSWSKATAYRSVHSETGAISAFLAKSGTLLRFPDDEWLRQIDPVSPIDSGMVGACSGRHPTMLGDGERPSHLLTSPTAIAEFEKHLELINRKRRAEREQRRRRLLGLEGSDDRH